MRRGIFGSRVFLQDILDAIAKIEGYAAGIDSYEEFMGNRVVSDAVCRNLEIMGEAAKHIAPSIKSRHPEVEWQKIAGLRDILIHAYFEIDLRIVWDIIQNKLPSLKETVAEMLEETRGA